MRRTLRGLARVRDVEEGQDARRAAAVVGVVQHQVAAGHDHDVRAGGPALRVLQESQRLEPLGVGAVDVSDAGPGRCQGQARDGERADEARNGNREAIVSA